MFHLWKMSGSFCYCLRLWQISTIFHMFDLNFHYSDLYISNLVQPILGVTVLLVAVSVFGPSFFSVSFFVRRFIISVNFLKFHRRAMKNQKINSSIILKKHFHFQLHDIIRKSIRWRLKHMLLARLAISNSDIIIIISNYFSAIFFISNKYANII